MEWFKENKNYLWKAFLTILVWLFIFYILSNPDINFCSGRDSCVW